MATSSSSLPLSHQVLRTAKDLSIILNYFIAFSLCKLLLTGVAEFNVGKFIVYSIGISISTLLFLNVVFCFLLYITKCLVLSGHTGIVGRLALRLLIGVYFTITCLSVFFITTSYKVLLWIVSLAFRPVKLLDAIGGSSNHYRIMASIRLINLYVELALLEAADGIERWFNVEIRGIRRLRNVNKKIPRLRYGALKKGQKKNRECVICLEYFRNEDLVRVVKCKHCYHVKCIDEWLKKQINCPICRTDILARVELE